MKNHIKIEELSYSKAVRSWLKERYGREQAEGIWSDVVDKYNEYLIDLPDYGGKENGHAYAIYGALIVFALYPSLPDKPPANELQSFVQDLFMGPFKKLGKIFDLNRSLHMRLIDKVFKRVGKRDQKDIKSILQDLSMFRNRMIRNIVSPDIILHNVRTRNLPKPIIFFMFFLFCVTATSTVSARYMAS